MFTQSCLVALALAGAALGAPATGANPNAVLPRQAETKWVNHDALSPIAQRIAPGVNGALIEKFNPKLHIASGCQPYTSIDDEGNVGGGLQAKGSATGGCRDQARGQTYARVGAVNNVTAVMYSWYFPKDQLASGIATGAHRHDWENVVVFVDDPAATEPKILGGAASGHGSYRKITGELPGGISPQVEYFASFPKNHELQFTDTVGKQYPISDWDALPEAARVALEAADYGKAIVPFKDSTFEGNLNKAAL